MRLFTTLLLALILTASGVYAQTLNQKLKSLKGKVKSVTVTTDSGSVTFEGKDAEKLQKRMKQKNNVRSFAFVAPPMMFHKGCPEMSGDDDDCEAEGDDDCCDSSGEKKKIIIINGDTINISGDHFKMMKPFNFKFDIDIDKNDLDELKEFGKELKKKMKIVIEDDNGETKTYTGEDAEKMMKDMEGKKKSDKKDADASSKDTKKKKMKIVIKDENGETKTYTGEDAEKKMKEMEEKEKSEKKDGTSSKDGKKKIEKKVIIKEEKSKKDEI